MAISLREGSLDVAQALHHPSINNAYIGD